MGLEEQIESGIKEAMKAKNTDELGVLRMLKAALINQKIEKKNENLSDDEILVVVQKQAKQRKESMDSFEKANRPDLFDKEKREYEILKKFLPEQLSDNELMALVKDVIQTTNAKVKADAGLVMKELMPKVKGKADGKRVNAAVMQNLV